MKRPRVRKDRPMADEERLTLSLDGELSQALRRAALVAGVSTDEWAAQVLAERLGIELPGIVEVEAAEPEISEPEPEPEPVVEVENADALADSEPIEDGISSASSWLTEASSPEPEAIEAEPVVEHEAVVESASAFEVDPEPVVEPGPVVEFEAVVDPEPVVEPESVVESESVVEPEPVVEPEAVVEPIADLEVIEPLAPLAEEQVEISAPIPPVPAMPLSQLPPAQPPYQQAPSAAYPPPVPPMGQPPYQPAGPGPYQPAGPVPYPAGGPIGQPPGGPAGQPPYQQPIPVPYPSAGPVGQPPYQPAGPGYSPGGPVGQPPYQAPQYQQAPANYPPQQYSQVPPPPPPPPPPPAPAPPTRSAAEGLADLSAWQQVTDDTQTFLISLPVGWRSRAWVEPTPAMAYPMAQTVSPDGGTTLFSGDSGIPMFLDPSTSMFAPPGMALRPPTPAVNFLPEWVQFRYGSRPGFQQLDLREDPQLREVATQTVQRLGSPLTWLHAARLTATYQGEDGRPVRAVFLATTRGVGPGWIAQVYGVTTVEDPEAYVSAVLKLVATAQATTAQALRNQQEQARIAASHASAMESINATTRENERAHQQRMSGIEQQGREFQNRMAEQRGANEAAATAWSAQQASSDAGHEQYLDSLRTGAATPGAGGGNEQQGFINALREETTVLDAQGYAHQVEAGADRYYHHEATNTWVGLEEHQDIVEVTGNDDFREGTIQN